MKCPRPSRFVASLSTPGVGGPRFFERGPLWVRSGLDQLPCEDCLPSDTGHARKRANRPVLASTGHSRATNNTASERKRPSNALRWTQWPRWCAAPPLSKLQRCARRVDTPEPARPPDRRQTKTRLRRAARPRTATCPRYHHRPHRLSLGQGRPPRVEVLSSPYASTISRTLSTIRPETPEMPLHCREPARAIQETFLA